MYSLIVPIVIRTQSSYWIFSRFTWIRWCVSKCCWGKSFILAGSVVHRLRDQLTFWRLYIAQLLMLWVIFTDCLINNQGSLIQSGFTMLFIDEWPDNMSLRKERVEERVRACNRYERPTVGDHEATSQTRPVTQVAVLRQWAWNALHVPGSRHVRRLTQTLRPSSQACFSVTQSRLIVE